MTLHRPSNVDDKSSFENVLSILEGISPRIKIVFPLHPRTQKSLKSSGLSKRIKNIKNLLTTKPLGYLDFLCLMDNSKFVLTDSGGIQEETTVLGVPCITLRNNTERPVTVEQGTNLLVSTKKDEVLKKVFDIMHEKINVKNRIPKLWDGKASERIVKIIVDYLKK